MARITPAAWPWCSLFLDDSSSRETTPLAASAQPIWGGDLGGFDSFSQACISSASFTHGTCKRTEQKNQSVVLSVILCSWAACHGKQKRLAWIDAPGEVEGWPAGGQGQLPNSRFCLINSIWSFKPHLPSPERPWFPITLGQLFIPPCSVLPPPVVNGCAWLLSLFQSLLWAPWSIASLSCLYPQTEPTIHYGIQVLWAPAHLPQH